MKQESLELRQHRLKDKLRKSRDALATYNDEVVLDDTHRQWVKNIQHRLDLVDSHLNTVTEHSIFQASTLLSKCANEIEETTGK